MEDALRFPPGFRWGTASSSYQTEGNNTNNQWSVYEQQPGAIWHGDRSGLACDWWSNAERDFDHMQRLGLNAHRLSIEWSRVEPSPGEIDHTALDRYRSMISGLRDRGIEPMIALHHFTDPLWFAERGGWENSESVALFQRYPRTIIDALGDLCDFWLTFNEPLVGLGQGWFRGIWPPHKRNPMTARRVFLNLLFSHAAAYRTIHARQPHARVSYAKAVFLFRGFDEESSLDRYAAGIKRHLFEHIWIMATIDGKLRPPFGIGQYHHPLADSLDFFAINYYTRRLVSFTPDPRKLFGVERFSENAEISDSGQQGPYSEYHPEGLHQICREVSVFDKPIYITENGLPDADDDQRPRWLLGHLGELHRAIEDGFDVRGYFHWAFVDNFEWNEGWGLRFGLVGMDPQTQERRERPSARLYGNIATQNHISREVSEEFAPKVTPVLFPTGPINSTNQVKPQMNTNRRG